MERSQNVSFSESPTEQTALEEPTSLGRKCLKKFIKYFNLLFENVGEVAMETLELNKREYTLISLIHLVNLEHMLKLIGFVWKYGAAVTMMAYILVTILISMPIYIIFMFMASYSKKSYIVFWDCVPLMRGLGYIYAMISIPDTFSSVGYGGNAFAFIYQYLHTANMLQEDCKRTPNCITPSDRFETYKTCSKPNYTFPMLNLIKRGIAEVGKEEKLSILIGKMAVVLFIFIIAAKGLSKIRKVIMYMQIVMIIIFAFSFFVTILEAPAYETIPPFLVSEWSSLWSRHFWLEIVLKLSQMPEIGNLIWLSTFKPRPIRIDSFVMYLHFIKIFVMLTAVIWVSIIYRSLNNIFNMNVVQCCEVIGIELAFAASTEIFIRLPINKVLILLWFSAFAILQVLTASYRLMSVVDSLVDAHKKYLGKYRFALSIVFLIIFLIGVTSFQTKAIIYSLVQWSREGRGLVFAFIFFFTSIGINYIYSVDRLVIDFHFTYKELPDQLWIISWKAISVIAMLDILYIAVIIYNSAKKIGHDPNVSQIIQLSLPLLIIIPCLLVFISTCFKHIARHSFLSATVPNERWGPYDPDDTIDRLLFVPARDLKYRRKKVICKHACLLNAVEWEQEVHYQNWKMEMLAPLLIKWDKLEFQVQRSEMLDTINALTKDMWMDLSKVSDHSIRRLTMY